MAGTRSIRRRWVRWRSWGMGKTVPGVSGSGRNRGAIGPGWGWGRIKLIAGGVGQNDDFMHC